MSRDLGAIAVLFLILLPAFGEGRPMLSVDGEPTPLFWAYGVRDSADLGHYADLGFNTVYVELPGDLNSDFSSSDKLIDAAERREFYVIIGIQAAMKGTGRPRPVRPTDEGYAEAARRLIRRIVEHYRDREWLVAWATQDDPAGCFQESDQEFRAYLKRWHFTDRQLARKWGVEGKRIDSVWIADALSLDDEQPFSTGPSSMDVAEYRRAAVMDLMDLWAGAIRESDPSRPILTGRLFDYKSLVTVPRSYDGVLCFAHPELLPHDDETHYVQMVDIGRQGNRFAAIPVLTVPTGIGARPRERLKRWFTEAAVHGAAGLAVTPWSTIRDDPRAADGVQEALAAAREQRLFEHEPIASAAILLEPYADGAVLPDGRGLCGFLPGLSENEPSELIYSFRRGTRFGLVDYLSQDDFDERDLSRYGVIFAPMALSVSRQMERALLQYVREGGVLVADIGFGVGQSSEWGRMSEPLMALFGVEDVVRAEKDRVDNAFFWDPLPLFPSIRGHTRTSGNAFDFAFNGWMVRVLRGPGCVRFGSVLGIETAEDDPSVAGILVREYGRGAAVLATMRLWSNWLPGHRLYEEFHGDLLARRPLVELVGERTLFPSAIAVVAARDGCVLSSHLSAKAEPVIIDHGADRRPTRGAASRFAAAWRTADGRRSDAAELRVPLERRQAMRLQRVPIQIEPYEGEVTVLVREYGPAKIVFELHGTGTVFSRTEGELHGRYGQPTPVRVTVLDGEYAVPAGSSHRMNSALVSGRDRQEQLLQTDSAGRLRFEDTFRNHAITLQPLVR